MIHRHHPHHHRPHQKYNAAHIPPFSFDDDVESYISVISEHDAN